MRERVHILVGCTVLKLDTIDAKLKGSSFPSDNLIVEEAVQELNSFLAQENMRLQELTDLLQEKHRTMSQEVLDQKGQMVVSSGLWHTLTRNFECFKGSSDSRKPIFILKSMKGRPKQPVLRNQEERLRGENN